MKTEVSRRQFLTGVGLAGLAAAGAGLAGCTPSSNTSTGGSNAAGGGAATSSNGLIAAASLNPQDYDYRQNTTDFKTLFSPFSIGSIQLNHRMVKSAAGSACYLNGPADELLEYYVNFAKGGVEMIWVEGIPWLEPGPQFPPSDISAEDGIAFGKKLVEECGKYGATLGYQWAPFAMSEPGDMTVDQITASEDGGAAVALQCKQMGFKAVEINSAGFNMGHHFLTRFHNTRTDDYGVGSLENRARFVTESIQKMKKACGDDFVVQVLIDCIEENDDLSNAATLMTMDNMVTFPHTLVTTIEEGIEFAKLFEAAGCDSMHLRLGPLSNHPCQFGSDLYFILNGIEGSNGYGIQWDFSKHWQGQLRANHSGAGMLIDIAARYKEALSIPCGTVTYMDPAHAPDYFEQALADGKIDFYIMNRPLTVDTEYVNKLKAGKIDEIAPCCRCLH
ncbi:MAG: twin-arginine translocation signal domain-containing protein, partial [Eggerthellaceae bacterium]|nr:twin-arginine translocation signal domain-containing protein [Eggerthellaceae bacterium]